MDLNTIWFVLVAVLFIGFFLLEGFDYGVGILMPFLGKDDKERRIIINTIGPHWDGNEVWLITAGGAIFAAFPHWYATLFSGFYLALFVILLALIVRGVAFANLVRGVPIDADMNYVGSFGTLLNPYALLGGLATLFILTLHGAVFLSLKTVDDLRHRARTVAFRVWVPAVVLTVLFAIATYFATDIFTRLGINPGLIPVGAVAALLASGFLIRSAREGWAFLMSGLAIGLIVITLFMGLFPRVMVSSLNPAWSLTIYNASSSSYTLTVMTIIALIFVPIVLLYQGWSYWIFRERLGRESTLEY
jgi:cytochrome d ubiquinol oxidase subunit II